MPFTPDELTDERRVMIGHLEQMAQAPIEEMAGDEELARVGISLEDLARRIDARLAESGFYWTPEVPA